MHRRISRPSRLLPALGPALLVAACGAGISTASPAPGGATTASTAPVSTAPPGTAPVGAQPGSTATATSGAGGGTGPAMATAVSHSGTSVAVTVSLTGPAVYEGGCVSTLEAHLVDVGGHPVGTLPASGRDNLHCLAIAELDLRAGETVRFTETLIAPGPGTFGVVGTLRGVGSIPGAAVTV